MAQNRDEDSDEESLVIGEPVYINQFNGIWNKDLWNGHQWSLHPHILKKNKLSAFGNLYLTKLLIIMWKFYLMIIINFLLIESYWVSASKAEAITNGPDKILRMISDRWAWFWSRNTHASKRIPFVLFLWSSSFLFGRIFLIGWKRSEVAVESRLIGIACFPLVFMFYYVELGLSFLFLNEWRITSANCTSVP